jgi:hypothetical protein
MLHACASGSWLTCEEDGGLSCQQQDKWLPQRIKSMPQMRSRQVYSNYSGSYEKC